MPRIPASYDLSGPSNLRSGRVIQTFDASDIGRGIRSFAGALGSIAAEQKQKNNAVDIARAEAYKTKGLLDAQNQFENDPDYSTLNKRGDPIIDKTVADAGNLIRDKEMRERWQADAAEQVVRAKDWLRDKATDKRRGAETSALDDANTVNYNLVIDPKTPDDIRDKARADISGAIDMAEHSGLITPAEASKRRELFVQKAYDEQALLAAKSGKYDNLPNPSNPLNQVPISDDALTRAMISVESRGQVDAESNKGASGLMQVMPGTAAEIAAELGDTDFPKTLEKQKEYLKNPAVSIRYGQKYMSDMLKKYDGDRDAALIAYNGGPERANAWLKAGRDDSVLPKETADYYKKVNERLRVSPDERDEASSTTLLPARKDLPIVTASAKETGRTFDPDLSGVKPELLDRFKRLQNTWGASIPIASGFRDPNRNAAAHGAKHSQHLDGNALDLDVKGMPIEKRKQLIATASALGFQGIGVYDNSIHIDLGARRAWGPNFHRASVPDWAKDAIDNHLAGKATVDVSADENNFQPSVKLPPELENVSPQVRQQVYDIVDRNRKERSIVDRTQIESAADNAPVAIQNTGQYTGNLPTQERFNAAYGPLEGPRKYEQFQAAIDTSKQVFDMRTMSGAEIQKLVEGAKPTSTGDNAALESKRFELLTKAAATTVAAREADPVTYIRNAYPSVNQAWENAATSGTYQDAITATTAAQQQLGIRNQAVLPKDVAEMATGRFKDANIPEDQRIAAVTGLVFATKDAAQRNAIFNQLVSAGLPDVTQGAVEAFARGDDGAGRRLFQAAIIDPGKLPGVTPEKQSAIDTEVQAKLMDRGQIGNVYYGLSDGTADNYERAQRDAKLIKNSVLLRMTNGEDMDTAITNTAKDLYGDLQVVEGDGRVNTQLLLPSNIDPQPVIDGLAARLPEVEKIVSDAVGKVPVNLEPGTSNAAVMQAVRDNYAKNVISQGYFKTVPGGYIFVDPYRGAAISDDKGKPVIFQPKEFTEQEREAAKAAELQQMDGAPAVTQTQEESDVANYGSLGAQILKEQRQADEAAKQLEEGYKTTPTVDQQAVVTPEFPSGASDIAGTPPAINQQEAVPQEKATPIRLDRQGLQDEIRKAREAAEKEFKNESRTVRTQKIRAAEREARDRWEKAGGKL